ncbi:putative ABC transport system ATP-binding protein [Ruaniaceae bacterium KH17]|nr:putative ABC transport system ATP-binding protein [Ruaniaceae bacterium KH17]
MILSARGVHHSFGPVHALRGVDIDILPGEALAIMGPSGSGKSTLLHVLAGVIAADAGTVDFDGHRTSDMTEAERAQLRLREFGFVFQFGQLLPDLIAVDNVAVPLMLAGMGRREAEDAARAELDELGVGPIAGKYPGEMSGGEAQRVAVARALVSRPRVLFADEPTGSLDSLAAEQVMDVMTGVARDGGTTVVLVTHDPRTASYAQREVVVRDGQITTGAVLSEA